MHSGVQWQAQASPGFLSGPFNTQSGYRKYPFRQFQLGLERVNMITNFAYRQHLNPTDSAAMMKVCIAVPTSTAAFVKASRWSLTNQTVAVFVHLLLSKIRMQVWTFYRIQARNRNFLTRSGRWFGKRSTHIASSILMLPGLNDTSHDQRHPAAMGAIEVEAFLTRRRLIEGQRHWRVFRNLEKMTYNELYSFSEVVSSLIYFLSPFVDSMRNKRVFGRFGFQQRAGSTHDRYIIMSGIWWLHSMRFWLP